MRSAVLFLLAIFTPCALLGWVSWRSMREEAGEIRRGRTTLYQQSADNAARNAAALMTGQVREFSETVDRLLTGDAPEQLRFRFHAALRSAWPMAKAGLVLDGTTGALLAQMEPSEQAVTAFVGRETWFFTSGPQPLYLEIPADNVPVSAPQGSPVTALKAKTVEADAISSALEALAEDTAPANSPPAASADMAVAAPKRMGSKEKTDALPAEPPAAPGELRRAVRPELSAPSGVSSVKPVTTTLPSLTALHSAGMASVPRDGGLFTIVWYRPARMPGVVFAAVLDGAEFLKALRSLPSTDAPDDDTSLVILDHQTKPAVEWVRGPAVTPESWHEPLVAREAGAALPHWEAAVFLKNPEVFTRAAAGARWRLGIIVTTASLAAIAGAFFILRDARRAALDARQKTDFVSNVSHELKTPLTSIRMFSDLLAANPSAAPEKTKRYAEVIASEAARLTRLINNVLNFSRMERGTGELHTAPLDLAALTAETCEHVRPQMEKSGFQLHVNLPEQPVTVQGDADAISQVLLNLLSNAEKYGASPDRPREVTVTLRTEAPRAIVSVSDSGNGVPRGHERRIFEKFHRAHDTLASGTAGSGLGLTIARRLTEAHGGTLEYAASESGGAVFTLSLALS